MDAFIFLQLRQENRRNARRRYRMNNLELRLKSSPFQLPEVRFKNLFRLNKSATRDLIAKLEQFADTTSIPFQIQMLTALHFYAHGSYQASVGSNSLLGLSQPSVSRSIRVVTGMIVEHIMNDVIQFPRTLMKRAEAQEGFHRKFHMPCILGAVDGCHVNIISPPQMDDYLRGNVYRNRKGQHSINVLVCCDADMRVTYADARFPGSVHDSAIWLVSSLRSHLRRMFTTVENQNSFLIGDSGFPLEPWLLTPFRTTTEGTSEHLYNQKFVRARQIIERCFGVVKSRFRCLSRHRVLHYDPCIAGKIIYAVFCLHNICINQNLYEDDDNVANEIIEQEGINDVNNLEEEGHILTLGIQVRQRYLQNLVESPIA